MKNYLDDPEDDASFHAEMNRLIMSRSRVLPEIEQDSIPTSMFKFFLIIFAVFAGAWSVCSLLLDPFSLWEFFTPAILGTCAMGGVILIDYLDNKLNPK